MITLTHEEILMAIYSIQTSLISDKSTIRLAIENKLDEKLIAAFGDQMEKKQALLDRLEKALK